MGIFEGKVHLHIGRMGLSEKVHGAPDESEVMSLVGVRGPLAKGLVVLPR